MNLIGVNDFPTELVWLNRFLPAATQAATGVTHPDSSLEALLTVLRDGT